MTINEAVPVGGIVAGTNIIIDSVDGANVVTISAATDVDNSVTAGTGISVTPGGGTYLVANAGVTSIVAGSGISVDRATGAVTVSTTGGGGGVSYTGLRRVAGSNFAITDGGVDDPSLHIAGTYSPNIDMIRVEFQTEFFVSAPFLVNDVCVSTIKAKDSGGSPINATSAFNFSQAESTGSQLIPQTDLNPGYQFNLYDGVATASMSNITVTQVAYFPSASIADIVMNYNVIPSGAGTGVLQRVVGSTLTITGYKSPDGVGPYWA